MGAIGILAGNEIGGLAGREGAGMIAKKLGACLLYTSPSPRD